jgi:Stigma-specific protein, Stig1
MRESFTWALLLVLATMLAASCSGGHEVGDVVLASYQQRAYAYPARIKSLGDDTVEVEYLEDSSTESLPVSMVAEFDWEEGASIECAWQRGNTYLPGTIDRFDGPGLRFVYANGTGEDTDIAMCRELTGQADVTQAPNSGAGETQCPGAGINRLCNGVCVNIQTDSNNCGGCGVVCPNGKTCDGHMFCRDAEGNL